MCVCGSCDCNPISTSDSTKRYSGAFCECDDYSCDYFENQLCGGAFFLFSSVVQYSKTFSYYLWIIQCELMLLSVKQCLIVIVIRPLKDPKEAYVTVVSASVIRSTTEQPVNALSARNLVSQKMG